MGFEGVAAAMMALEDGRVRDRVQLNGFGC